MKAWCEEMGVGNILPSFSHSLDYIHYPAVNNRDTQQMTYKQEGETGVSLGRLDSQQKRRRGRGRKVKEDRLQGNV